MTKEVIDVKIQETILKSLYDNGINDKLIFEAKKMDVDLVRLFYEKIVLEKDLQKLKNNVDVITKSLLGIYGNYVATSYFEALGYEVENEYPVYDENKKLLTKADLAFVDNNGVVNLCEVKTTSQIIDNIRNYKDDEEKKYNGKYYYDMDSDIIKYKEIGVKLIKQVTKLKKSGKKVLVVIFNGCFMDDIIKDKLSNLGVSVFTMAPNVKELEEQLRIMVTNVSNKLGVKNEERRK